MDTSEVPPLHGATQSVEHYSLTEPHVADTHHTMLTEMETMSELAEIKSEIGSVPEYGAGAGSVESNSTTPQPHHNFAWVSINLSTYQYIITYSSG